jgi:DNA adenine methylase
MRSLTAYYGGKAGVLGAWIVSLLPPHKTYGEPYGGMANVLMQKVPAHHEFYNDLNSGLVTLFRVVRNPWTCAQLVELLNLTPYAREEWKDCHTTWKTETDEVEKARKVFVILSQSYVGSIFSSGWKQSSPDNRKANAKRFVNAIDHIKAVCKRLRTVEIENQPALKLCERWDNPNTCLYLDPPYVPETRTQVGDYVHEMSYADHEEMLGFCQTSKSNILLSGYSNELYDSMLLPKGWDKIQRATYAHSAMSHGTNRVRTEVVWLSPSVIKARPSLFN